MSGTVAPSSMPASPGTLSANTNIGQPLSGYYQLFTALTLLNQGPALTQLNQQRTQLTAQQQQLTNQQAQLTQTQSDMQAFVDYLQQQIIAHDARIATLEVEVNSILGRLAAFGIP